MLAEISVLLVASSNVHIVCVYGRKDTMDFKYSLMGLMICLELLTTHTPAAIIDQGQFRVTVDKVKK